MTPVLNHTLFLLGREDAPALARMEAACFTLPWSLAQYEKILPAERRFLADLGEPGVTAEWNIPFLPGCIGSTPVFGLFSRAHELQAFVSMGVYYTALELEVYNIAVSPEARKQGLGRQLLGRLLGAAARHGFKKALLEVRQGNSPALALYAFLKFIPIGRRKGYYTDNGEDALILARSLGRTNPET